MGLCSFCSTFIYLCSVSLRALWGALIKPMNQLTNEVSQLIDCSLKLHQPRWCDSANCMLQSTECSGENRRQKPVKQTAWERQRKETRLMNVNRLFSIWIYFWSKETIVFFLRRRVPGNPVNLWIVWTLTWWVELYCARDCCSNLVTLCVTFCLTVLI